jgi:hypothetical protein
MKTVGKIIDATFFITKDTGDGSFRKEYLDHIYNLQKKWPNCYIEVFYISDSNAAYARRVYVNIREYVTYNNTPKTIKSRFKKVRDNL